VARSPRHSRVKGANGEREFRDVIRSFGFTAERDGQTRVARWAGEPNLDVRHDIPGVHAEVKRCETYMIDKWLAQAEDDARRDGGKAPWVCFRKSKQPWRCIVPALWLLGVMRELANLRVERDWLVAAMSPEFADSYTEFVHGLPQAAPTKEQT
jgi:hypothetical protein